jgi:pimeloyl-ACP methyl ester carboxylesterase
MASMNPTPTRIPTPADVYRAAAVEHVDAGDAVLACRRFGAGPALLLVHGFPLHGFTWRKVIARLARDFTCVTVDLAGLGDSEWSAATDFGFHAHARRLQTVADRLGLSAYAVMAQDTGATVARCLALVDGARMRGLVMLNTEIPGHRPPWIREYQALLRLPGSATVFRRLLALPGFVRSRFGFGGCFTDMRLVEGEFADAFVAPIVRSARRTDGLARYLVGLRWDVVDAFAARHADVRMPTLLVWGEDDPTFPVARARPMARQLPECRGFVAVPGTKLLLHEERPDEVCRHAVPFLQDCRDGSPAAETRFSS